MLARVWRRESSARLVRILLPLRRITRRLEPRLPMVKGKLSKLLEVLPAKNCSDL